MDQVRHDYKNFHVKRFALMANLLDKHLPTSIERSLDIGGAGDVTNLADHVRDTYGADTYSVDLGSDVELGKEKGLIAQECNVDQSPLPFEDGYFDLVVFASVIEHLYNPHFAIGEITRVIRPGGFLLLEAPNAVAFGRRVDALVGKNPFHRFNEYNAEHNKCHMEHCSVFYTVEEAGILLQPSFDICDSVFGMHAPPVNPVKGLVRSTVAALFPAMSDCFAVMARRRA
jgi:SAM-dependent methyltransferase